jgi:hypothetical protein
MKRFKNDTSTQQKAYYAECRYPECHVASLMGLNHPLDGVTNPKYKLLHFLTTNLFLQREEGTSF